MTARQKAAGIAALGIAPIALGVLSASPAAAHGSMEDPVSRVSTCFAEGPESPQSAACKAAVKASGPQAFYDWNEVNIADAAGKHKEIIPDGKLCSAGRDKYKGLDVPRADWPASKMTAGKHTFSYKATAPHKGTFTQYITKDGYDPAKPLKWSDLESKPISTVKDPQVKNGSYSLAADVPKKSGKHLIYSVWQRSDSPEAFYSCSDVTFGGGSAGGSDTKTAAAGSAGESNANESGAAGSSAPQAPSDEQIASDAAKSTVDHSGHGADHQGHNGTETQAAGEGTQPNGGAAKLAHTGGGENDGTTTVAIGGAAALAVGAAVLFGTVRRRAVAGRHRS